MEERVDLISNRKAADICADIVWGCDSEAVAILDCRVMKQGHALALKFRYAVNGDRRTRTLRTFQAVENFVNEPIDCLQ